MTTVREFARDHKYGPLDPVRVTAYTADTLLDDLQGGDMLSWSNLENYSDADVDNADLFLIRGAYGRDAYGRDLIAEVNYEVLEEDCGDHLVRVSYTNTDQWAVKADLDLPEDSILFEHLDALESYPILDEGRWSELEWKVKEEDWDDYGRSDFRREIERAFGETSIDGIPEWVDDDDLLDRLMYWGMEQGKVYDEYETGGGTYWPGMIDLAKEVVIEGLPKLDN